jgi:hypothetical protein
VRIEPSFAPYPFGDGGKGVWAAAPLPTIGLDRERLQVRACPFESGEPADPAVFVTEVPGWRVGDEFLAGAELTRFRIVAIDPTMNPDDARATFNAVWVVEPSGDAGAG